MRLQRRCARMALSTCRWPPPLLERGKCSWSAARPRSGSRSTLDMFQRYVLDGPLLEGPRPGSRDSRPRREMTYDAAVGCGSCSGTGADSRGVLMTVAMAHSIDGPASASCRVCHTALEQFLEPAQR